MAQETRCSAIFFTCRCPQRDPAYFNRLLHAMVLAMILNVAIFPLGLPLFLYRRFALETKHSFDTTIPTFFVLLAVRWISIVFGVAFLPDFLCRYFYCDPADLIIGVTL